MPLVGGGGSASGLALARAAPDVPQLLLDLAARIQRAAGEQDAEIAHLKATLDAGDASGRLAALSVTSGDGEVDLREALVDGVRAGELIVNLRAEGDPAILRAMVLAALETEAAARPGCTLEVEHEEHFRPAPPEPTHRDEIRGSA